MSKLQGKSAVVTGASKGIGAGIARELAAAGANVVVNFSASREGADAVVGEITKKGGKATAIQGDVAKAADIERLFAETKKAYGKLDILVNNAGVYGMTPLETVTEEEFHRQFNINVLGLLLATREAVKIANPAGASIINVSSAVTSFAAPGSSVYAATKGAVDVATRVLARELASRKIRVNVVSPGYTITEGVEAAGFRGGEGERAMVSMTPLGRPGQPADIARVVTFLASDESAWLTGENLFASGGLR